MSRKAKADDGTEPKGANGVLFINYDLSDEMRKTFKTWREKYAAQALDMVDQLVASGYQLSVKTDTYNDCVGAYLMAKTTKTENDGYILTGRGSTAFSAVMGVLYRHFSLFDGQWPVHNRQQNALDDD